jgi:hypothetical protein
MSTELIEQKQQTALSTAATGVQSRQMAEVQSAMIIAKRFPRDEQAAIGRLMSACKRTRFASQAEYVFPRGSETVSGPTIRFAEAAAQAWGNLEVGIIEIERKADEVCCQAFAWCLESNMRRTANFTVSLSIKANNKIKKLTDPRDISMHIASQGSRFLRNCILAVIPNDVIEDGIDQCRLTLKNADGNKAPKDRIAAMLPAFLELGVTKGMIVDFLKHNLESASEAEIQKLRKIYQSLKQEQSSIENWFKVDGVVEESAAGEPKQDQVVQE